MEDYEYDEILQKLPSHKIYNELNNVDNNVVISSVCKREDYKECGDMDTCLNICKKIEKNLKYLSEIRKLEVYYNRCSHYMYWVYKEIWNLFKSNSNPNNVEAVITEFLNLQSSLTRDYGILNCHYNFSKKSLEVLKTKNEEKYLFDYFTNFEYIRTKETCDKVDIDKYIKYLNFIRDLYNGKKDCCVKNISKCPNYFLNCGNELDPSKLLSELHSEKEKNCGRLKSIISNTSEEKPDSTPFSEEFMESIYITRCPILSSGESSSNNSGVLCNLSRTYMNPRRSVNETGKTVQEIRENISPEAQVEISSTSLSEAPSEKNKKQEGDSITEKINLISFDEKPDKAFRWNFGKGKLSCSPKKPENDEYGTCKYMEELVKDGYFVKAEDSEGYKFKRGPLWNPKYLVNISRNKRQEKLGKIRSLHLRHSRRLEAIIHKKTEISDARNSNGYVVPENNRKYILQNTFFRISIVVAAVMGIIFVFYLYFKFTPFGSHIGKIKKRKKRYRTNFAELNTERIPRRFIKRTYRNSERRRFSVVNIE
ncbi:PIR Superfamily Protein [Plasmodium malariae]|uniref:PIR Superfamily Protein n=1 Tax=Plasmodium malariae TaxID=5858 RepID=A0A1A8WL77_PLAMA|nr:PIR Superfamily Protein [Plasmodium malariae]